MTLFNNKQFVLHLNIDEFLKDPKSIKFCCNKYDNSFINNHYGHIITGNLKIVNNERLRQLISKGPKYREPKQISFEEAREGIQTGIEQFIERILNNKGIHKNHISEWKSHVMASVKGKIQTLKNKIKCRSVKSIFSEHGVKNIMFSLKEDFVIVPIDKAANNVAFICKHFYALTIIKELNLDCHLSNQDDNNTYIFINDKTKDQIIKEHKLYLSKDKINLPNNMQDLPVMYWIRKVHKNPNSFPFIITSPVCSMKLLSKDYNTVFKLFYE